MDEERKAHASDAINEPALHQEIRFRLPIDGFVEATFRGRYDLSYGVLHIGPDWHIEMHKAQLLTGLHRDFCGHDIYLALEAGRDGEDALVVRADGTAALRADTLTAPSARSTWIHGFIGLAASAAGFAAGYLYLHKAQLMGSAWASKMGYHTAAWHALLVLTLFPASVWGQRIGIRAVQLVSLVFWLIHLGIALANALWPDAGSTSDGWIAALNALSGALFLASVLYGQRAYRDMDPIAFWRERLA